MPHVFDVFNRGKRSVTLDLRTAAGRELALELITKFDVFFESFRPGYLAEIGLGFDACRAVRPDVVYCSASGFGATGPYSGRAGHDLNYASLAGLVSPSGGPPIISPIPYIDMASGMAAALAISIALIGVKATKRAIHIDLAMSDVALSFNGLAIAESFKGSASEATSEAFGPLGGYPWPQLMLGECPCYGVFRTLDDRFISLANVEPKFWRNFLSAIGRPDLEAARFAVGEEARRVRGEIARCIEERSFDEWDALFLESDVCYAPVLNASDAYQHQQFTGRVVDVSDRANHLAPVRIGLPMVMSDTSDDLSLAVPSAGEDNSLIFGELGYGIERLQYWEREGVI
jgi:crotonobetainyl-CoA:carnitine CoA-transferase CaiB-like acyl-CoA transferase